MDIEHVLEELTLGEKAAMLSGSDFWHTAGVERLGVPAIMCADGPHGMRVQLDEADHGGLSASVPATCFPTASAIASSWDPDLVREVGAAVGKEARHWGVSVVLGPGINIKRSPLCGRNFEYYSEDPYLTGELGAAMVNGIQSAGVGASLKHYAANNQEEDRLRVSADVDERSLREIYLAAFERIAIEANPWTVMCAYNRVNGIHASEHRWLLTEVLREEWGWDGVVVSDWGAVHDRVAALEAGLDWEMPPNLPRSPAAVIAAVGAGTLDESVVDRSVRRMLDVVSRASAGTGDVGASDESEHHDLARRAAAESIVLLKNDGGVLPLRGGRVAVIGEFARSPRFQGAGSSQVNPTRVDVALDELTSHLGADAVVFAPGYRIEAMADDEQLSAEAVSAAAAADVVVGFFGLPGSFESEGFDRTHIDLPPNQVALLERLAAANPNLVVVLVNGSVVRMSPWVDAVPAVLECWLGGQAAGGAIADVLSGTVDPSGRLAETIPVRIEDTASFLNFPGDSGHVRYGEGIFVGYRSHDRLAQPVTFPFGHGLSYTSFDFDGLQIDQRGTVTGGDLAVEVRVAVHNRGDRAGAEVVQVYVSDVEATVARPINELKGFAKVRLDPGGTEHVTILLDQRAFSFWSESLGRWAVEAGDFRISVGRSSRDLVLSDVVAVDAPPITGPITDWSTLHEWIADPVGRSLLEQVDGLGGMLGSEELVAVIGSMPVRTLAGFPGFGFGHESLDRLLDELAARDDPS